MTEEKDPRIPESSEDKAHRQKMRNKYAILATVASPLIMVLGAAAGATIIVAASTAPLWAPIVGAWGGNKFHKEIGEWEKKQADEKAKARAAQAAAAKTLSEPEPAGTANAAYAGGPQGT